MAEQYKNRNKKQLVTRVRFEDAVFSALSDVARGLNITAEQFIKDAVERELRRRNVTWWESRIDKTVRGVLDKE